MSFLLLFWEYFQIGLFTIGGGYAMIPMVQQMVQKHGWLTQAELLNFMGIAESTPGPFSINLATFVGMKVGMAELGVFGGVLGAIIATVGVVLPSLVVIVVVTKILNKFMQNKWVKGALNGIRPVVVALILSAVVSVVLEVVLPNFSVKQTVAKLFQTIGLPSDQFQQQWQGFAEQSFGDFNWVSLLLICVISPFAFVKIGNKKINPVFLILASGVLGLLVFGVFGVQQ